MFAHRTPIGTRRRTIRRRCAGMSAALNPLLFPRRAHSACRVKHSSYSEGAMGKMGRTFQICAIPPVPPPPVQPVPTSANATTKAHTPNISPAVSPPAGLADAQVENNLSLHRKFQDKKKRAGPATSHLFFPVPPPLWNEFMLQGRGGGLSQPNFLFFLLNSPPRWVGYYV